MTNMSYLHTVTICIVDLVVAAILLLHCHLLKIMGGVIGGTGVGIPVCINTI